jgi:hypothetical protein
MAGLPEIGKNLRLTSVDLRFTGIKYPGPINDGTTLALRASGVAILVIPMLLGFLMVPGFLGVAYAGTTTDLTVANGATVCPGTLGGVWEPGNNCLLSASYTVNGGDTLIVDTGVAFEIASGGTLNVDGTLNIVQLLVIFGGGVVNVHSSGVINNANGIDVYGVLDNYGTINNNTAAIFIGLFGGFAGVLNNYGVINQNSAVGGFAEITITSGGVLNNECGGVINNPPPGVINGSVTTGSCPSVPEFPAPATAFLALVGGMLIPLLLMRRKAIRLTA